MKGNIKISGQICSLSSADFLQNAGYVTSNTSPDHLVKRQTSRSPVEGGSTKHKALLQRHLCVMLCNTCPVPRKGSQLKRGRYHTALEWVQELWRRTLKPLLYFVKICAGPLHLRAVVFRSFLHHQSANQPALQVWMGEMHLVP